MNDAQKQLYKGQGTPEEYRLRLHPKLADGSLSVSEFLEKIEEYKDAWDVAAEFDSWTEEQVMLARRADSPKRIIRQQYQMLLDGENTVDEFIDVITRFNNEWKEAGKKP
jgi:hypothetical protein